MDNKKDVKFEKFTGWAAYASLTAAFLLGSFALVDCLCESYRPSATVDCPSCGTVCAYKENPDCGKYSTVCPECGYRFSWFR